MKGNILTIKPLKSQQKIKLINKNWNTDYQLQIKQVHIEKYWKLKTVIKIKIS